MVIPQNIVMMGQILRKNIQHWRELRNNTTRIKQSLHMHREMEYHHLTQNTSTGKTPLPRCKQQFEEYTH